MTFSLSLCARRNAKRALAGKHKEAKPQPKKGTKGSGSFGYTANDPRKLLASGLDNLKTRRSKAGKATGQGNVVKSQGKTVQEQINDLLVKNPNISGPTLLNLLKSQGFTIVDTKSQVAQPDPKEKTSETASASSNTPSVRAGVNSASTNPLKKSKSKESAANFSESFKFQTNMFLESDSTVNPDGTIFKVVLLQEGLGNLADRYFYTKQSLESAIPVFEGKKIYANHPSALEEQTRPERDVRDILGHFEAIHIEETDDGRCQLVGNVVILQDQPFEWARSLMRHSVDYAKKYPDKEFVGLSINAGGDATEADLSDYMKQNELAPSMIPKLQSALAEGVESVKLVNTIQSAVSCDLVTEAGAGGKILQLLEEEKTMAAQTKKQKEAAKEAAAKAKKLREDGKGDGGGDGGDAGHDDAAQDKELIKSMLKKHLGIDDASPEEMEMYQSAMEAYKEMGMEDEKAHEAAGNALKLHKHLDGKGDKKDQGADDSDSEDASGQEAEAEESEESESEESENKESARVLKMEKELTRLTGVVAKYEERDQVSKAREHAEKLCVEAKLPMSASKKFQKLVEGKKNLKAIDELFQVFKEGNNFSGGEASDVVFGIEKQAGEKAGGSALDFSDCKI